ncbi:serpin family protein [Kitasatospora sp. NPDC093558]|uniref:serpin family protein n=1 Tax=Kitasatospora sp. NPDC093558 TaxID=3155201 RepID=UPI00343CE2A7
MSKAEIVRGVNGLGARWAEHALADGRQTVLMPAGVWPLLGLVAPAGSPAVRRELEDVLGLPADAASERARQLLGLLGDMPGTSAALGLWTAQGVRPRPEWLAGLPADVIGRLTGDPELDRKTLDAWASRCTDGLIDAMPVQVDENTRFVLASALTVKTEWIRRFSPGGYVDGDTWGRDVEYLSRSTSLLDRAAVADTPAGPVTEVRVLGKHDIDVHLLLGEPDAPAGAVLAAGFGILAHRHPRVTADRLPTGTPGPGLTIGWQRSYLREPVLAVCVPQFTVEADHDLLEHRGLFGLTTASRPSATENHLPGLSGDDEPLVVASARQAATASFGPRGFRAAAVTALGVAIGAAASLPPYSVRHVRADFGRPFGFLAVHRTSGLVLAAGWVTDPDDYKDPWADFGDEDDELPE